jgi:DNA-binding NarL/FixJ family response regulator
MLTNGQGNATSIGGCKGFPVCPISYIRASLDSVAKILLAEGNDKLRILVKALIETRDGWHVCEAVDGHDAVSKALGLKPDLVVLDFAMSGLNGLQAAAKITAACPSLPTILYTFYGFSEMVAEAKKVGIREVVSKGERGELLLDAIEKHLEKTTRTLELPTLTQTVDTDTKDKPPTAN